MRVDPPVKQKRCKIPLDGPDGFCTQTFVPHPNWTVHDYWNRNCYFNPIPPWHGYFLSPWYRESYIGMDLMNRLWRIKISKLDLVWRWFWNKTFLLNINKISSCIQHLFCRRLLRPAGITFSKIGCGTLQESLSQHSRTIFKPNLICIYLLFMPQSQFIRFISIWHTL